MEKIGKDQREQRESNWSTAEKENLRECINMHIDVIEHKGNDTSMIVKKKNSWKAIQGTMASAGYHREVSKLKSQWVRMKVSARKAVASIRRASIATGNSAVIPEISVEDDLVQSMIMNEFLEDDILIDSNCVDKYKNDESPMPIEFLECDIIESANNIEDDFSESLDKGPTNRQQCFDSAQKDNSSPGITPIKNIKTSFSSNSKLKRLRSLPKTASKNSVILERQRQIVNDSLHSEEINKLQVKQLNAEIDHEKNLYYLKVKQLQQEIRQSEELHALKLDILREKVSNNSINVVLD